MFFKFILEIFIDVCKFCGWGWFWLVFDFFFILSEWLFLGWFGRGGLKMLLFVNFLVLVFEKFFCFVWILLVVLCVLLSFFCFVIFGIVIGFFGDVFFFLLNDIWLILLVGWRL